MEEGRKKSYVNRNLKRSKLETTSFGSRSRATAAHGPRCPDQLFALMPSRPLTERSRKPPEPGIVMDHARICVGHLSATPICPHLVLDPVCGAFGLHDESTPLKPLVKLREEAPLMCGVAYSPNPTQPEWSAPPPHEQHEKLKPAHRTRRWFASERCSGGSIACILMKVGEFIHLKELYLLILISW
jgi:hypothetical protein